MCRQGFLTLAACCLLSGARAAVVDPTLNLKEIEPRTVSVASNRVFITLAGPPPRVLASTNSAPLKRREGPAALKRVAVTDGKEFVGRAVVWLPRPTPKAPVVTMHLTFETPKQAATAAQAFRHREAKAAPQQREPKAAPQQKQKTPNREP